MRAQTKLIALGAIFIVLLSSIIVMALIDDVEGPVIYKVDILPVSPKAGDMVDKDELTVIVASHDPLVLRWCDRLYTMRDGEIVT